MSPGQVRTADSVRQADRTAHLFQRMSAVLQLLSILMRPFFGMRKKDCLKLRGFN